MDSGYHDQTISDLNILKPSHNSKLFHFVTDRDFYDMKCALYLHSPLMNILIFPGGVVSKIVEFKGNSISMSNSSMWNNNDILKLNIRPLKREKELTVPPLENKGSFLIHLLNVWCFPLWRGSSSGFYSLKWTGLSSAYLMLFAGFLSQFKMGWSWLGFSMCAKCWLMPTHFKSPWRCIQCGAHGFS